MTWRRLTWVAGAGALVILLLWVARRAQPPSDDELRFPALRVPAPIATPAPTAIAGPLNVVVHEVRFVTKIGHRVRVPRAELHVDATAAARAPEPIHVPLVRITGLEVIAPPDTVSTGLDLFVDIPGPRLAIDRLLIERSSLGALAHPTQYEGRWLWRVQDLDIDVRDIRVGGRGTDALRLARLQFNGERRGRPYRVEQLDARLQRTNTNLALDAHAMLALLPELPGRGIVLASGTIQLGERPAFDDVALEIHELPANELAETIGIDVSGGKPWSGRITADGGFREGVAVSARLAAAGAPQTAMQDPRIAVEGVIRLEPKAEVDLTLDARNLRVDGDSGVIVNGQLRSGGPADSIRVTGVVAARRDSIAASGIIESERWENGESVADGVVARIDGLISLEGQRSVDARVTADSIPLDLLPVPPSIDSVRGLAHGAIRLTGRLSDPLVTGRIDVSGAAFRVRSADVMVSEIAGPLIFDRETLTVDHVRGRARSGTVDLSGRVLLGDARSVDLRLDAGAVQVLTIDSTRVLGFAQIVASGPIDRPVARGEARLISFGGGRTPRAGFDTMTVAVVHGSATLARHGDLSATVIADSLPFSALPISDAVEDVHGSARGALRVSGTLDSPRVDGELNLHDAGLLVKRTRTRIDSLNGRFRIENGVAFAEDVRGRAGAGTLTLDGSIRLRGEERGLELTLVADNATLADTDSASLVGSARLRASGALDRPTVDGAVTLLSGRVHEDNFTRESPIDLDAPPYADLVERVPWIENSRLRRERNGGRPSPRRAQRFRGRIAVQIRPGVVLYDEDSEMFGTGRIDVTADSTGINASGLYAIEGGYYVQYREEMRVAGGVFSFSGHGFEPRVTVRSVHVAREPLGSGLGTGLRPMDHFPPIESFAIGMPPAVSEEARRLSLLPESKTELGAALLYGVEPEVVTGQRMTPFWAPDNDGDILGKRAKTQSVALLWGYFANELYDFLPISRAYLNGGLI
ncbi:MAG: translocation/assembly module TamB domain-containing protein, partial [Longimicrobiales bacterium]